MRDRTTRRGCISSSMVNGAGRGVTRRAFLAAMPAAIVASRAWSAESSGKPPEIHMRYRPLGRTALRISEISMGGHNQPTEKKYGYYNGTNIVPEDVDDLSRYVDYYRERTAQIACALDVGINFFDVSNDREVRSLAVALGRLGRRNDCYVNGDFLRGRYRDEKNPDELRASTIEHIEKTIRVLRRDCVDTVRIVTFDGWSMEELAAAADAFDELKRKGKARFFGISGHDPEYLLNAVRKLDAIEIIWTPYSFAHRLAAKELFPLCQQKGIGVITIKPFHAGAFFAPDAARKKEKEAYFAPPAAEDLARLRANGPSLAQSNLAYILANPHITATVPGMNSCQEILANASVSGQAFEQPDAAALQQHAINQHRLPPCYRWLEKWTA